MKETKTCINCNKTKLLSEFYYRKDRGRHRSRCITCYTEYRLNQRYNITTNDYEEALKEQNYKCKICTNELEASNKSTHIDHCHVSGEFRGVLCHHCNTGLGLFKDNSTLLANAIRYLEETNTDKKI